MRTYGGGVCVTTSIYEENIIIGRYAAEEKRYKYKTLDEDSLDERLSFSAPTGPAFSEFII